MSDLFAGFGTELPTVTQIVLGFSKYLPATLFGLARSSLSARSLFFLWSRTEPGRFSIDSFPLKDSARRQLDSSTFGGPGDTFVSNIAGWRHHAG